MVKKTFFIALSALLLNLSAQEFSASVSQTEVHLSESFSLLLTLKDFAPKEAPNFSSLKKNFLIQSQQQSSQASILNNKMSSSTSWRLTLIPKREGVVEIPAISVDTAEGVFMTQPITLNVTKGGTFQSLDEGAGLNVTSHLSNTSPYKNEPFLFTAAVASSGPLYNIQAEKIELEDAIVQLVEEPKLEEKVMNGRIQNVVEFKYLITPLKPGSLKIPPLAIHGAVPEKRKGKIKSIFDDDFNPFAMLSGFDRLKPFRLMTESTQIDVQSPIPGISPWLPAKELKVNEQWLNDETTIRVGEPFSLSVMIQAEGVKVSQLPHLEDLLSQAKAFKVYADKPEEQEKMVQGIIHSMRKEQYTLIPQEAGTLTLPEISIPWWDSIKKEKRTSTIPARTLQVLPEIKTTPLEPEQIAPVPTTQVLDVPSTRTPTVLYVLIGMLTFFLIAALMWCLYLQRKIAKLTIPKPSQKPVKTAAPKAVQKEKKEKLPDLNPT